MFMTINLKDKFAKAGAIGIGASRSGAALAFAMPHLIAEENSDFQTLALDNNIVVIEHKVTGKRYKVCTSRNYRFDVSPSFAKGIGRTKIGVDAKWHLGKIADGVAFCRVVGKERVEVLFKNTKNIELNDDGVATLTAEFLNKN